MSDKLDIFCYGLKTDFRAISSPVPRRFCAWRRKSMRCRAGFAGAAAKATMNTRIDPEGRVIKTGEQVLIDNQQAIRYIGLCYQHWRQGISHG